MRSYVYDNTNEKNRSFRLWKISPKNAKTRIKRISVLVSYNTIWITLPIRYYTARVVIAYIVS